MADDDRPTDPPPAANDAAAGDDTPASPTGEADAAGEASLLGYLFYGLSLPERTVRSLSAVAGGLLNETAARLIPTAFRSSKSYALFVQQALDMAVHDFGGVPAPERATAADAAASPASSPQEVDLARKAVGGMLDIASLSTLHLSPMTVLAAFSDLAYGSSHYLRELSAELKRQGVIDSGTSIDHVSDLLDALQTASNQATDALDQPPINLDGLRQTIEQTRQSIQQVDPTQLIPQAEIARLWDEMETAAQEAEVGILDVSTTMTMFAMNRVTLVGKGALSSVTVAGNLLDQHILRHYVAGLAEIRSAGLYATLNRSSEPYLEAVWNNFGDQRVTWTEDFLSGRMVNRGVAGLRGWWAGESSESK